MASLASLFGAHPRSRGENTKILNKPTVMQGSSPLTRGKLSREVKGLGHERLIPAHAGKTPSCAACPA